MSFKEKFPFEYRLQDSRELMENRKNIVPVVVEFDTKHIFFKSRELYINDNVFIVNKKSNYESFLKEIKHELKLSDKDNLVLASSEMNNFAHDNIFENIYNKYKDYDGFLYLIFKLK